VCQNKTGSAGHSVTRLIIDSFKEKMMKMGRRDFVRLAQAGMAALPLAAHPVFGQSAAAEGRKLKVGLIGCGGRGSWISTLFKAHGGFEFVAVADYFQERAQRAGEILGVAESRRFSGLEGCRRLMDCGVEAVVLQTPPYFFPGLAEAAVEAKLHIYMAKPVAIDVPGTLKIQALALRAEREALVFMSDYQLPIDPVNMEVCKRVRSGALGRLQAVFTSGWAGGNGYQDPPPTGNTIEERLKDLVWCNDVALGGDYIVHYDIHIIDAVIWALGKKPLAAMGVAAAYRPSVHGDALDSALVTYQFEDGVLWSHQGVLGMYHDWIRSGRLTASLQGTQAAACLSYAGKSYVRGGQRHFSGGVPNPEQSVKTNIDSFYNLILAGRAENLDVRRAVESNLTAILGREAAVQRRCIEMGDLLKQSRELQPDLSGLKL